MPCAAFRMVRPVVMVRLHKRLVDRRRYEPSVQRTDVIPLSIIVPCHRVIASNGDLQGYAGGLARKLKLSRNRKKCIENGLNNHEMLRKVN